MLPVSRQIIRIGKNIHYFVENMGTKNKTCGNRAHMNFELEKSLEVILFNILILLMEKKWIPKRLDEISNINSAGTRIGTQHSEEFLLLYQSFIHLVIHSFYKYLLRAYDVQILWQRWAYNSE